MTKEQLFAILDESLRKKKRALMVLMIIALILIAVALVLFTQGRKGEEGAIVCLILGGLLGIFPLLSRLLGQPDKDHNYAKDVLLQNPGELVWAYQLNRKTNGVLTSIDVVLNFRNKTTLEINDRLLPGKDTKGFMLALYTINPKIKLGFTKELEAAYRKKLL